MVFDRVVPSNELDNANIELTNANRKQVEINTLLNVASQLDNDTLLQNICDVLEIDYEIVKDKTEDEPPSVSEVRQTLEE